MLSASICAYLFCVMKTTFALLLLLGASPFALANSIVSELLPSDIDLAVLEAPVFGSLQGSFGLMGAVFFAIAVLMRLKRPGR